MSPLRTTRYRVPMASRRSEDFETSFRKRFRSSHTASQIPGEGVSTSGPPSLSDMAVVPRSSIRFLTETRRVHTSLSLGLRSTSHHIYDPFLQFPIDRSTQISYDLSAIRSQFGLEFDPVGEDHFQATPGIRYARLLDELAFRDPYAFLSHVYATSFAHVSGGKLIASRIENALGIDPLLTYQPNPNMDTNGLRRLFFETMAQADDYARSKALMEAEVAFKMSTNVLRSLQARPEDVDDEPPHVSQFFDSGSFLL